MTTTCVIKAHTDHVQIVSSAVQGNELISVDINVTLFVCSVCHCNNIFHSH